MAKKAIAEKNNGGIKVRIQKSFVEHNVESVMSLISGASGTLPSTCIAPPYAFEALYKIFEYATFLRPNIEAYMTNIDSFGHHYIPITDLTDSNIESTIRDALLYSQYIEAQREEKPIETIKEPDDTLVDEAIKQLKLMARMEYIRLTSFFSTACPDMSFTGLRRITRQDLEVLGNAFWEILRNDAGEVAELHYQQPLRMRLTNLDKEYIEIKEIIRETDVSWVEKKRKRRFRRFVQLGSTLTDQQDMEFADENVWFKEFGDPRIVSRKTGNIHASMTALKKAEPGVLPATEILHFKLPTPTSIYGIPRWIQNLPCVNGSRELDEVNYSFFQNNVVPPLALLVSGGSVGKAVTNRFEEYINEHLKGKKGMFRMLILEAQGQKVPGESGPRQIPKIQFVPLRDAQQQDALFQVYDMRNEEKLAKAFRLPRILRGDDSKIPRATAFASLKFADEQVFEPEREAFDDIINRKIMIDLGVRFWSFRSNAPIVRDPEKMAEMIERLVKVGVLLPKEARKLASDIFNETFQDIAEEWTNKPLPYVLAQIKTDMQSFETGSISLEDQVDASEDDIDEDNLKTKMSRMQAASSALNNGPHRLKPLAPLGGSDDQGD